MVIVKHSPAIIPLSEFSKTLQRLFSSGEFEEAKKLMELESIVYDDGPAYQAQVSPAPPYVTHEVDPSYGRPTLRISIEQMVRNMVGDDFNIKVEREDWDYDHTYTRPASALDIIAIHLCKKTDNPNGEVVTIRERTDQFPSTELRTKLELLRR